MQDLGLGILALFLFCLYLIGAASTVNLFNDIEEERE